MPINECLLNYCPILTHRSAQDDSRNGLFDERDVAAVEPKILPLFYGKRIGTTEGIGSDGDAVD